MRTLKISLLVFILRFSISAQDFWEQTNGPYPGADVRSLCFDSSGFLFAGTNGAGIFRTSDDGDTWHEKNNGLSASIVRALEASANNYIFAGTNGGIFRSSDSGENWIQINNGLTTLSISCLAISPNYNIFSGSADSGIFRSTDYGENWAQINSGLSTGHINALAVNSNGVIFAATGTGGNAVFKSTNNGETWTSCLWVFSYTFNSIAINSSGHIYVSTPEFPTSHSGGIYKSTNGGENWQIVIQLPCQFIAGLIINVTDQIFAWCYTYGVYYSFNNGFSWIEINSGLTNFNVQCLGFNSKGYVFAGTNGSGVFRSLNTTLTEVDDDKFIKLVTYSLKQNYPNPFNPVTKIKYTIPSVTLRQAQSDILVTLKVYDILGREVATLVNEEKPAGEYEVEFNAAYLPSGIYFYQLRAEEFTETKKMVLLR